VEKPVTRRRPWIAVVPAIAIGLLLPAAPADARRSCTAVRAGGDVIVKTREAVVFAGPGTRGGVYGCHRSVGRAFRLDSPTHDIRRARLAGRYVAYVARVEEFMEPLFDRIVVFDLVRGRPKAGAAGDSVRAFVVKRNGSTAWAQGNADDPEDPQEYAYEIRRISNEDDEGTVVVDGGPGIDPDSLVLSADRRSIRWTNAGEARSAPLR
jgi:hypothetical protein